MSQLPEKNGRHIPPYLSALGAWALAFGCSVGWGSFVMPGTTFLPVAGPAGTAIGLGIGAAVMLVLALNYHYLMNRFPDGGGTYTYTKKCFGYDHGFINAWFLILTYIAIIWANASALPLIARTVLGSTFQFGFDYEIAGFHVYMGEILLAVGAMAVAALICLRRSLSARTQAVMAVLLLGGVIACFVAALCRPEGTANMFSPAYAPEQTPAGGIFTIFALAPWAFVGFESISHSAAEAKFPLKKSFRIMAIALLTGGIAYIALSLMATTALPEGQASWTDYTAALGSYSGTASQPTFFAAEKALGTAGTAVLGTAALCAIFTGLIGNFIALSRLLRNMSEDGMLAGKLGKTDRNHVPRNAIFCILAVSVALPFLGRTAISWIVDVTTVGATIAYAFASASAWKTAREEKDRRMMVAGMAGIVISVLFALEFLIPNVIAVKTLSTESYLILAAWAILGFAYFRHVLRNDRERRLGRSIVAWVVLLGLVIFTSTVWMRQNTDAALDNSAAAIRDRTAVITSEDGTGDAEQDPVGKNIRQTADSFGISILIQISLIVVSLFFLLRIYSEMQKRERQMEVEKALAEESSRAKTSFLSNMSHEIRTPMNAIIGLDNIALRDPELSPKTREHLEKIGTSAKHLLGLINDILDMTRIESGRMVLKNEEFSFREFLGQINIMIGGQCQDKGLQYECSTAGDLRDYYFGDDMKLKQVLINILGNAVKFTEAPGTVAFTAEQLPGEEGLPGALRFTVRDTGIGMDPEFIPKIFESFTQENATAANRYGGSGLGMAITRNFVEMMGGRIEVESKKGVGSVFTVTVPMQPSDRTAQPAAMTDWKEGLSGSLAGRRVLMAEDVEQNAEILADLLELEEMESERAENGEEALRMFREHPEGYYDCILMDVRMPVMDGLTAAKAIRALPRADAETIPIIAMTANVFDEDMERSLAAGMNAHLSKPIEPDLMYETIARLLAGLE